ncbi:MAG: electron transfer flavoprotein subunit alpha/FixB family protein [Acidobacteriaceae bacterium]
MILVVAEHKDGKLAKSTYELVTAAKNTGRDGPVTVLVLGSGVAAVAAEAAKIAEQVLVADQAALGSFDPEVWSSAVAQIAREGEANTVLIGGSRSGREYSPRVAVKLDAPLLEDVISLSGAGRNVLRAQHYTYLTRVTETLEAENSTVIVTVKPGAFTVADTVTTPAEQFDVDLELPARRVTVTGKAAEKTARVALGEAEIVVAGGRGLGTAEKFTELVEGLADKLGAAVGATRAVVDAGWRPYAEQVGQTGKTVQPKLYIAVGISGAVQHLSGMSKSKCIVAINRDADAPIFQIADYGIVGDVQEILPAMIAEIGK